MAFQNITQMQVVPVRILNGRECRTFSSESPDTYLAIRIQHREPGLISKDDIVPLLHLALSLDAPETSSRYILLSQWKPQ